MNTKRYLALVMALVMAFSLVVPASAASPVEQLASNDTDTARLTVYVDNEPAAVGSIDRDMKATLKLNYGSYAADSEVTVAGQTKSHANQTTFTLKGNSYSGIDFNGTYFPGFNRLTESTVYAIQFVDELGATSKSWDYTFKKSADTTSGVTLEVVPEEGTSQQADDRWQALKAEAFTNTDQTSDDSYIKLAAGSYLQMDQEKLTVNSELLLDNFSNSDFVDANVTNAKAKLTYTTASSGAYQLLLKKGTQFVLGHSIAEVKQDLLVTMTNVTKSYNGNILKNVYDNLTTNTEQALAENLLKVFSEIAGLARPAANGPVEITFGTPTTSTSTPPTTTITGSVSETVEKTTTTIVTGNGAGTTNTTTVATENTTTENTNSNTTTVVSKVTETRSEVEKTQSSSAQLTYEVTYSGTTTTTTFVNGVQQGTPQTTDLEETQKTVTITAVAEDSSKDLDAMGEKAKVGTPLLNNVADDALAAIVTEAVTAAQTSTEVENISVKIVIEAEAKNADNATVKEYEVTPKAYTYVNGGTTPTSEVKISNENLASNAQFTITLPVPDALVNGTNTKKVTVTHTSDDHPKETFITDVLGEAGKYYVTFPISHFSVFSISANNSVSHVGDFTFVEAYEGGYNFVDTVYLNAQDTIYMNIVVFVRAHFGVTDDARDDGKYIHVTYAGTDLGENILLSEIPLKSAAEANAAEKDMKKALVLPGYWCYCDKITSGPATGNSNGFYTIRIPVYPNHMGKVMTVSLYDGNNVLMPLYQNAGTSVFTNDVQFIDADNVDLYTVEGNVYQQTTYRYLSWLKSNGSVEYQNIAGAMMAYGQAAANIPQWNSSN